ncbi:hypothetical protein Gpo141_00002521 [Globisporangium polare]
MARRRPRGCDGAAAIGQDAAADDGAADASSDESAVRVVSRVNAGVRRIDDLVADDESDELVEQINLHGNFLESMDGLEAFSNVVELCLSNNFIQEVSFNALEQLVHLRILDLSANSITSTLGFPQLPRLEELSLAHNSLRALDGLTRPIKFPKLRYLDLRHNDIDEYSSIASLQHHKRLTQLRLQAQDGSQVNPLCELDDYPHTLLKMLPRLTYLDEEEVLLLKEVGNLYMPKYQSILRRIKRETVASSSDRIKQDIQPSQSKLTPGKPKAVSPPLVQIPESTPQDSRIQRVLIKEASTNTEFDFEKEMLRREQAIIQKENDVLAREKALFSEENAGFAREKELSAQILKLQEELALAITRATKAEMMAVDEQRLQEQTKQQHALENELTALKDAHRLELDHLKTVESNLMRTIDITQEESKDMARVLHEKENELRAREAALIRSEANASELTVSLDRALVEHNNIVQRLTSDAQSHKDRHEQAEKRNLQLEMQVKELKTNVEAVYNKCIEKDDEIHRLKRNLLSKAEDMEDLKAQHAKATDRVEKMAQQQNELYKQRLETSVAQIEMEFRKEHYHSMSKLQLLQKKHHEAARDMARLKDAYQMSLQREADTQSELSKLQAILAGDKRRLVMEDARRTDEFRVTIANLSNDVADLKVQLAAAKEKDATLETIEAASEELRVINDRLRAEMNRQASEIEALKKLEDDLRAALKVKDVMLDHQQGQLTQLRKEREDCEQQLQEESAELQAQVEDLELALDENIQKAMDSEAKQERTTAKLREKERALQVKAQEIDDLSHELDKKHGALELIETEMERMRDVLNDQNALFQKRLEKHLEAHREELERVQIGAEEAREVLRIQWEAERRDMMQRYASVSSDLRDVAAQNAKLRVDVETERKRIAQSDQEMRVLLAQIDRERHLKKESLKHIKSLFEQLQQESP